MEAEALLRQTLEMDDNDTTLVMQRLEPFVGRWTMEARFPGAESTGPSGLSTFEWMVGGQFLLQRTESPAPGAPEAVTIVGPDPEGTTFTQHYFDSRGIARLYSMIFEEGIWTLQRDTPDFTSLPFRQASWVPSVTMAGASTADGNAPTMTLTGSTTSS